MNRIPYIYLCVHCIPSRLQLGSPLQPGDTLHVPGPPWEDGTEAFRYYVTELRDCENQA